MAPEAIERHLKTRQGLRRLPDDERFQSWSQDVRAKAFPGIELAHRTVRIRSHQRRWEYVPRDGANWIVADLELSTAMSEMQALLAAQNWQVEASHIFLHTMLGDAFREVLLPSAYAFCVRKAHERRPFLRALRQTAMGTKGWSASSLFAYLHELAHIVVAQKHRITEFWSQSVQIAFAKLAAKSQSFAENPQDGLQSPHIQGQLRQYVDRIQAGGTDLEREALCDIIAALAFLNLLTERDLFLLAPAGGLPLTLRQFGDALLNAAETLQHMQLLSAIRQFAGDFSRGSHGVLGTHMIDLTVRSNCLVFLLSHIYSVLSAGLGGENSGFTRALSEDEVENLFLSSIARRFDKYHERLTNPFEDLTAFFLDEELFPAEYRAEFGELPDPAAMLPDRAIDDLRAGLYDEGT
jgi:hypothetical protein